MQFSTDGGTLPGLERVLDAMNITWSWGSVQLFLDDDVLEALLEGRVEDAVRAAASYLPR